MSSASLDGGSCASLGRGGGYNGISDSSGTNDVACDHCCAFKREVLICDGQFPKQRSGGGVAGVRNEIWSSIGGHCL